MNKDYLAMMDEGELEAYAKVLGFTTAAAQTAADKAKLIEQKRGRCAELTVLGIAMSIPVKRAHDRRFIDAMTRRTARPRSSTERSASSSATSSTRASWRP